MRALAQNRTVAANRSLAASRNVAANRAAVSTDYLSRCLATRPYATIEHWSLDDPSGIVARGALHGYNGTTSGATVGQPGMGDGRTSYLLDGINDTIGIGTAEVIARFNPLAGTISVWTKVPPAVWIDATTRYLVHVGVNGSTNFARMFRNILDSDLRSDYRAGGVNRLTSYPTGSPTGWFHVTLTWDKAADEVKMYFNGVQVGVTLTGLGTWVGTLVAGFTQIGSASGGGFWSGHVQHVTLRSQSLSAGEIAELALVLP